MLSVGEILKKERLRLQIPLEQVEKETRIRLKFIEAIENNQWKTFSSHIYITGIIKTYSNYLQLNSDKMLAFFRREYEKIDDVRFKRRISSRYLTPQTKQVVKIVTIILVLIFVGYFTLQVRNYLLPPNVIIIAPTQNVFYREDKIKVLGKTEKEALIMVRGERVYPNLEGEFEFQYPLKPGNNEVKIEVTGANGKKTIVTKSYIKKQ